MIKLLRKHARTIIIITFLAFVLTIPAYYLGSRYAGVSNKPTKRAGMTQITQIARVNGELISLTRFFWLTNQLIKMQTKFGQPVGQSALLQAQYGILNDLITFALIQQEARRNKLSLDKKEVEKNLENLKLSRGLKSNQQLDLFLKREAGISLKDYKQLLREELLAKKMAEKIRSAVVREKNEPDIKFAQRQFEAFDKQIATLKNSAKIEVLYPHLQALDYIANHKYDEAIGVYQKVIKENSADLYAHLFLGQLYAEQNKDDLALNEIQKAAALNETSSEWRDPEIYIILAQVYLKNKKPREAKAELDKAALIAGESLSGHQALFLSYTQLGAKAEAEKEKQEIQRIRQKMMTILKAYQNREETTARIKGPTTQNRQVTSGTAK